MDSDRTGDFPHRNTRAAQMLADALRRQHDEGVGLRKIAERLEYKQAVVLSHMATGRVPIPVDRAGALAGALELDPKLFMAAVLEQRFPMIQWDEYGFFRQGSPETARGTACFGELTDDQEVVIREVLRDRNPRERWLTIPEVAAVNMLRTLRPHMRDRGLSPVDVEAIKDGLEFGPF